MWRGREEGGERRETGVGGMREEEGGMREEEEGVGRGEGRGETEAGVETEGLSGLLQTHLASSVNLGPRATPCCPGVVSPSPSS